MLLRLPAGDIEYTLRRTPLARRLRITVHPERGLVVTIPPASRRGWARPADTVEAFMREREGWIRRHLDRQLVLRARLDARPPLDDGRIIPYLGMPHRVRVVDAAPGARASRVSRIGGDDGDELLVERGSRDRRPTAAILDAWFRRRARAALQLAIARHAPGLRRDAREGHDPGHDEPVGKLLPVGRAVVQLAARAGAAAGARRRRCPRAVPPAGVRARTALPCTAGCDRARPCDLATMAPPPRAGPPRRAGLGAPTASRRRSRGSCRRCPAGSRARSPGRGPSACDC